jgi:hypothetical protein
MIVVLGLVILVAAAVVGAAGVLSNGGRAHELAHQFAVFGYHVMGSNATLFVYGIVVGAVALTGLSLLLAGALRALRRERAARHALEEAQRQTAVARQERDDLTGQRETAGPESDLERPEVPPQ